MKNVKKIILIVGTDKREVGLLRRNPRRSGYFSIPCQTVKILIEELNVLPTCETCVELVIIQPGILQEIDDDLVYRLSSCSLEVPFVLMGTDRKEGQTQEIFQRLCHHRTPFDSEKHPLDSVLWDFDVQLASK